MVVRQAAKAKTTRSQKRRGHRMPRIPPLPRVSNPSTSATRTTSWFPIQAGRGGSSSRRVVKPVDISAYGRILAQTLRQSEPGPRDTVVRQGGDGLDDRNDALDVPERVTASRDGESSAC